MVRLYNGIPIQTIDNTDVVDAVNSLGQKIDNLLAQAQKRLANDYRVITIDLGQARTDELVASNVVSFNVLAVDTGATASMKLFSTSNDAINVPSDLDAGDGIADLDGAELYITNTAQAGKSLKLLVFRRT